MGYVGSELSNAQVRSDGEDFRCFMQGFSQWVSGSYRIDPITGTAIFPRRFTDTPLRVSSSSQLLRAGGRLNFPVPPASFVSLLSDFIATPAATKAQYDKDVGFKQLSPGVRRIEWLKISTLIDLEKMAAAAVASSVFEDWESFIEQVNRGSPAGVNRAYQTSLLWVRMVTEQTILTQFQRSVIFSVVICFVSLIVFTKNIVMALYASLSVAGIMICVIGFILTAGWRIGLIEALCLMLLIGFSVDYVLHISHAFSHSPTSGSPYESIRLGVGSIGLSIFSSAMTTTISSIPLLFCTIQLFAKIGSLVIASTILSLMFSMGFFVALLASFGPSKENCGFGCFFRRSDNLAHAQLDELEAESPETDQPSDFDNCSHTRAAGVEVPAPQPADAPVDDAQDSHEKVDGGVEMTEMTPPPPRHPPLSVDDAHLAAQAPETPDSRTDSEA